MSVTDIFVDSIFSAPLSSLFSSSYDENACLTKANKSGAVTQLDNRALDLASTWHPTGYYAPSDIRKIVAQLISAGGVARGIVGIAPNSTSDAAYMKRQAIKFLDRNDERGKPYLDAAAKAESGNGIVDAPAFKTYVTNSLVNLSQAYVTAAMLSCAESWAQHALSIVNNIIDTCKSVVGIIANATMTLVKVGWNIGELFTNKWFRLTTVVLGVGILSLFAYGRVVRWKRDVFPHRSRVNLLPPGEG